MKMRKFFISILAAVLIVGPLGNAAQKVYPFEITGRFVCDGKTQSTRLQVGNEGEMDLLQKAIDTPVDRSFRIERFELMRGEPKPFIIINHRCHNSHRGVTYCSRVNLDYRVKVFMGVFELSSLDKLEESECNFFKKQAIINPHL